MSEPKLQQTQKTDFEEIGIDQYGHIIDKPIVEHPIRKYLRMDRMPHIWCPGCGIGTFTSCFAKALSEIDFPMEKIAVIGGIGCSSRFCGYVNFDSIHTTHGRAIPFATGAKLANPELKLVVVAGDGDLAAIGGNHFIHAARRNMDVKIFFLNNFNYGMTGGQVAPTTPKTAKASTMPYGSYDPPFNVPHLAAAAGAVYVARWTILHVKRLVNSIKESMMKPGFTIVEVLTPCPTLYGRKNRLGEGLDMIKYYRDNSTIDNDAKLEDLGLEFQGKIICGKFVDIDKPAYHEIYYEYMENRLGEDFVPNYVRTDSFGKIG